MYVLLMLASPWAFSLALQRGWGVVLAGSITLWLLAQAGLARWLYHAAEPWVHMPVPYGETGAFNSFAWQLLWVLGLWLGATRLGPQAKPIRFPPAVVVLAAGIALTGLVWRHVSGQAPFGANEALNMWFDKWQLAPLRLLNLLALLVLLVRFGPWLTAHLPRVRMLETLGAASLAVFCVHLVVVLLTLSLFGAKLHRSWAVDLPLLAFALGSLYLAGRVTLGREQRPRIAA